MNHTHTSEPRVGLSRRLPLPSFVLSTIVLAMAFALCMGPIVSHAFAQDEPAPPVLEDELGPPPPPGDQDEPPLPPADDQNQPAQPAAELEAPAQAAAEPGEPGQPAAEPDEFAQPGADQEQAAPPEAAEEPERPPQPAADASGGIVLNFKDATLDAVLEYLSEAAGFVVVKDITVLGRITVISQQPVSAEEAVGLLNTILKDKGYMAVRMGRTLKVALLSDARKANLPVRSGNDPEAIVPSDSFITQVIPLRYVDAAKLKQDLASLISTYADLSANAASNSLILTDTEANIRRIVEIVQALDTHLGTVADIKVFQLQYANATSVAKLINDVFKEETTTQQQTSPFGGGSRRFRMPGGEESSTSSDDRRKEKVVASADDRTNTVVVSASTEVLKVIESMIRELDSNPSAEQAVLIYRLKNAKAANLAKVLNDLFTVRSSTGQTTSGASRGQSSQGPGGFISRMMAQQG
ncbi:MAG TPA: secretin N-terminal domain-containing protein, partial [Planctomycetota bacterium]|nr:secretin N-terminal domain-containing protein [Planctomycetota bacterium]